MLIAFSDAVSLTGVAQNRHSEGFVITSDKNCVSLISSPESAPRRQSVQNRSRVSLNKFGTSNGLMAAERKRASVWPHMKRKQGLNNSPDLNAKSDGVDFLRRSKPQTTKRCLGSKHLRSECVGSIHHGGCPSLPPFLSLFLPMKMMMTMMPTNFKWIKTHGCQLPSQLNQSLLLESI